MILIGIPLGLKGEIWFKWLGIPLGILIGFNINRQIYSAVAQSYTMPDTGWQVAWMAFAVIWAMTLAIIFHCFKRFGSAILFSYVCGLAGSLIIGIINTILTHQMEKWIAMIVLLCCYGIGFVLGLFFIDYLIIIGTAFAGGYNIVGGIGTYARTCLKESAEFADAKKSMLEHYKVKVDDNHPVVKQKVDKKLQKKELNSSNKIKSTKNIR